MYIDMMAALEIYYYMIAVDGVVNQPEMEKFMEIVIEMAKEDDDSILDDKEEFEEFKEDIDESIKEWNQQLEKAIDEEEYFDVIKERIDEIVSDNVYDRPAYFGTSIAASALLWNLMSIAESDKEYSLVEQKLIRYVVRKLNIDKDIYLEMENTMKSIQDINKEVNWLKTSNKPYAIIESNINKLSERQKVIFDSVKELITEDREV